MINAAFSIDAVYQKKNCKNFLSLFFSLNYSRRIKSKLTAKVQKSGKPFTFINLLNFFKWEKAILNLKQRIWVLNIVTSCRHSSHVLTASLNVVTEKEHTSIKYKYNNLWQMWRQIRLCCHKCDEKGIWLDSPGLEQCFSTGGSKVVKVLPFGSPKPVF